jgi:uncharacterized membrane protein YbhN (UPF0104 family)
MLRDKKESTIMKPISVRRVLYFSFSLIVTIGVFSFLFSQFSLREVMDLVLNCDRRAFALFVLLSLLMSLFRLWRYQLVLHVSGYRPSSVALYCVVLVRNFFSDLLPARLGTLVYIYMVTNRLKIPVGAATASFALSFVFDIIALVPMLLLAALFAAVEGGLSTGVLAWRGGASCSIASCRQIEEVLASWQHEEGAFDRHPRRREHHVAGGTCFGTSEISEQRT